MINFNLTPSTNILFGCKPMAMRCARVETEAEAKTENLHSIPTSVVPMAFRWSGGIELD